MIKAVLLLAAVGAAFVIEVFLLPRPEALPPARPGALAPTPTPLPAGITDLFDGQQGDAARQPPPPRL